MIASVGGQAVSALSMASQAPVASCTGLDSTLEVEGPGTSSQPVAEAQAEAGHIFRWTPRTVSQSLLLFLIAAVFEVGGGWLIWQSIRAGRPWWWGFLGSFVMMAYGFVPTLQPSDLENFGRIFAVYGGFFIVYSYGWGWGLDDNRPDTGYLPACLQA